MKLSDLNKPISFGSKKNSLKYEDLLKKPINLLPEKSAKEKQSNFIKQFAFVLLIMIVVTTLASSLYFSFEKIRLSNDIAALNATLDLQKDRINNQQLLDLLMDRINYKSELVEYINTTNMSAKAVLNAVESATSSDMKYISINFISKDTLSVSGLAANTDSIASLLHQLKIMKNPKNSEKAFFNSVLIESIQQSDATTNNENQPDFEFVLNCQFGGQEDASKK